jgi:hypothetical protein
MEMQLNQPIRREQKTAARHRVAAYNLRASHFMRAALVFTDRATETIRAEIKIGLYVLFIQSFC